MKTFIKILKIAGIVFAVIIVLQIAAGVYLMLTLDPNDEVSTTLTPISQKIGDALLDTEITPDDKEYKQPVSIEITECETIDGSWERFKDTRTSLSFCYNTAWGAPTFKDSGVSPQCIIGEVFYYSFPNTQNNLMQISQSSLDYNLTCDHDVGQSIDWSKINFSKTNQELNSISPNFENPVTTKLKINGVNILRVNSSYISSFTQEQINSAQYYIPNIDINNKAFNLQITADVSNQDMAENMIKSMNLENLTE